jgi:tetratricopeptide (TPR) repeat protein
MKADAQLRRQRCPTRAPRIPTRRLWRLSPLALFLLGTGGCSFATRDTGRPIIDPGIPTNDQAAVLLAHALGRSDTEAISKSLRKTQRALRYFDIQKYDDNSYLYLPRLRKALETFPENPFAWVGLGAYLGLSLRPSEAAWATRIGLASCDHLIDRSADLEEMLEVPRKNGLINLATFSLQMNEPDGALEALERFERLGGLSGFDQIALYRLRVRALAGVGDFEAAKASLETLQELTASPPAGETSSYRYDYPQFFEQTKIDAVNHFLSGMLLLGEGRWADSSAALTEAIRLDPEFWEAKFLLASADQGAAEDPDGDREAFLRKAAASLNRLLQELPRKEALPAEFAEFNLGNVKFRLGELDSARMHYLEAISRYDERSRTRRKRWERGTLTEERPGDLQCDGGLGATPSQILWCAAVASEITPPGTAPSYAALPARFPAAGLPEELRFVYSEAWNNLGNVFLQRRDFDLAEASYRIALLDNRYEEPEVAHLNLARLLLEERMYRQAADEAFAALGLDPFLKQGLELALTAAEATSDPALKSAVFYGVIDQLGLLAGSGRELIGFADDSVRRVENQMPLLPAADRAKLRARIRELTEPAAEAHELYATAMVQDPQAVWALAGLVRTAGDDLPLTELGSLLDRALGLTGDAPSDPETLADRRFLLTRRAQLSLAAGDVCAARAGFDAALQLSPAWPAAALGARAAGRMSPEHPCPEPAGPAPLSGGGQR